MVFGAAFHRVAVLEESEEEIEIEVPSPLGPVLPEQTAGPNAQVEQAEGPSVPGLPPPALPGAVLPGILGEQYPGGLVPGIAGPLPPPALLAPQKQKVVRVVQKPSELGEPLLIYAATIAGVTRLETGELRVMAAAREGPALCPT